MTSRSAAGLMCAGIPSAYGGVEPLPPPRDPADGEAGGRGWWPASACVLVLHEKFEK